MPRKTVKPKKNLTIRIDDELREQLQLLANIEMRSLANLVYSVLTNYVIDTREQLGYVYYDHEEGKFLTDEEFNKKFGHMF
ncbi:hypothetical protein [Cloacibacillus sp. An23]|uniref:hypothetical protein n=1 Tax=Cloacibacillus sp. An23 TaxID=1965591 RepID=UPI000B366CCD|nr:hypothetical protein [Cloacibacillus sp. An23]OUO94766.1 hypothetical protein B5F39_02545 [Cloacibacillus sp. An23]